MKPVDQLTTEELGALITETLGAAAIDVVLTGGSCASIYADNRFGSLDLDFIDVSFSTLARIKKALLCIDFKQRGKTRYFDNPETELYIEFPTAPLAVGDEVITSDRVHELQTDVGVLRLLSPTDCVKDRLANVYYHRDRQCFEQALLVAQSHPLDWDNLEAWHQAEGQMEGFEEFKAEAGQK